MWVVDFNTTTSWLRTFSCSFLLRFMFVIQRTVQFSFFHLSCACRPTESITWRRPVWWRAIGECSQVQIDRLYFLSQTAMAPKRWEAGLIVLTPHSLVCNPVSGRGCEISLRAMDRVYQAVLQWILLNGCETSAKRGSKNVYLRKGEKAVY